MFSRLWVLSALLIALSTLVPPKSTGQSAPALPVVRVGTIVDGPWGRNQEILAAFQSEILALTEREFDVRFPESKRLIGDFAPASIKSGLDQLLADPEVDLILALGPVASHDVSLRGSLPKPVVAPFIIDPAVQGLPEKSGASGVRNLSSVV